MNLYISSFEMYLNDKLWEWYQLLHVKRSNLKVYELTTVKVAVVSFTKSC